jgi:hypothetical protein
VKILALSIVAVGLLAGCGGGSSTTSSQPPGTAASVSSAAAPPPRPHTTTNHALRVHTSTSRPGAGSAAGSPATTGRARIPAPRVPAAVTTVLQRFASCMRSNGVPAFPAPKGATFNLNATHLNPTSPQYKSAEAHCESILQAVDPQSHTGAAPEG